MPGQPLPAPTVSRQTQDGRFAGVLHSSGRARLVALNLRHHTGGQLQPLGQTGKGAALAMQGKPPSAAPAHHQGGHPSAALFAGKRQLQCLESVGRRQTMQQVARAAKRPISCPPCPAPRVSSWSWPGSWQAAGRHIPAVMRTTSETRSACGMPAGRTMGGFCLHRRPIVLSWLGQGLSVSAASGRPAAPAWSAACCAATPAARWQRECLLIGRWRGQFSVPGIRAGRTAFLLALPSSGGGRPGG